MKIKINNKTYIDFDYIELTRSLDSVASTFSFGAKFRQDNLEQIAALLPLGYQDVVILDYNDKLLLTGTCLNTTKADASESSLVNVTGYSKCGVLSDSNVPVNVNSLQSNMSSLKDIVEKLIEPYGLNLIINPNALKKATEKIDRTYTYMDEEVDKYLVTLALRKNIVVSHDEHGNLVLLSIDSSVKSKHLLTKENTISMELSVNGQEMHSEISSTKQLSRRNRKNPSPQVKSSTVKNPLVSKYRPKNNRTNMNQNIDLAFSAKSFFMEELENISVEIALSNYFEDLNCGDFVDVLNPALFIFKPARMLIKSIKIDATSSGSQSTITCVIPESYTGEVPKNIFEL